MSNLDPGFNAAVRQSHLLKRTYFFRLRRTEDGRNKGRNTAKKSGSPSRSGRFPEPHSPEPVKVLSSQLKLKLKSSPQRQTPTCCTNPHKQNLWIYLWLLSYYYICIIRRLDCFSHFNLNAPTLGSKLITYYLLALNYTYIYIYIPYFKDFQDFPYNIKIPVYLQVFYDRGNSCQF